MATTQAVLCGVRINTECVLHKQSTAPTCVGSGRRTVNEDTAHLLVGFILKTVGLRVVLKIAQVKDSFFVVTHIFVKIITFHYITQAIFVCEQQLAFATVFGSHVIIMEPIHVKLTQL